MNLFDAKIISTKFGYEIYVDEAQRIEVTDVHIPSSHSPFYECLVGVEYSLLRDKEFYGSRKNYFWIRLSKDFNSVTLVEPETQSLFAVKDEKEREATKMLIEDWLIKTDAFQQSVNRLIEKHSTAENSIEMNNFLNHLLHINGSLIHQAPIKKMEQAV